MYSNRLHNNTIGANQPVHLCDCGGKWAKENEDIWTIWQPCGGWAAVSVQSTDSDLIRRDSGHPTRHIRKWREITSGKVFRVQSMGNESS